MLGRCHGNTSRRTKVNGETTVPSLSIVDPLFTKNDVHGRGGQLTGTLEIPMTRNLLADNKRIDGLQLDLTVSEATVISLIRNEHRISYMLQGEKICLDKSFDVSITSSLLFKDDNNHTETKNQDAPIYRIPFSVDLSQEDVDKLGSKMKAYNQEDTLGHDKDSTTSGYCTASKRGPMAARKTSGTCEVKTILQATLSLCDDDTGKRDNLRGYHVPALNMARHGGAKCHLSLAVHASERAPMVAICGLWEISRPESFTLKRTDHKMIYWTPHDGDLEIVVDDCNSRAAYKKRATKTVAKLAQRISWSAESKDLLHYVEIRSSRSPPICKPVVHCTCSKRLIVEDQCIYWQYPLSSVNEGSLSLPKSRRLRSTYRGESIEVYHELWVYTYDAHDQVVATSQPMPVVIRM